MKILNEMVNNCSALFVPPFQEMQADNGCMETGTQSCSPEITLLTLQGYLAACLTRNL